MQQARQGLYMYLQANSQFIDEQVYNDFDVECIQQRPLSSLDSGKLANTIRKIFDFKNNKQYDYFYKELENNIKKHVKEEYAVRAVQSYYTLDLEKLTNIIKYCIKNGFDPNQKVQEKPKKIERPEKQKPKEAPQQKPKQITQQQPPKPRPRPPIQQYKPTQPKNQYAHVKSKLSTHLEPSSVPSRPQFKLQKHQILDTSKAKPKISTHLDKNLIVEPSTFKIQKYEMPETVNVKPRISSRLQKDKIPQKKQFKLQKYQMPQTQVAPKYLTSVPKKVIIVQETPLPQFEPLEEDYLKNNKKIMSQRLEKLYNFYCVQNQSLGNQPTFSRIKDQSQIMNLGKFMQFCQYTRVFQHTLMTKQKLMCQYKKVAAGKLQIDFKKFQTLICILDQLYLVALKHDPKTNPIATYQARLMLGQPKKLAQLKKHRNIIFSTRDFQTRQQRSKTSRYKKQLTIHSGKFSQDLELNLSQKHKSIQAYQDKIKASKFDESAINLKDLAKMKLPKINWIVEEQQDNQRPGFFRK